MASSLEPFSSAAIRRTFSFQNNPEAWRAADRSMRRDFQSPPEGANPPAARGPAYRRDARQRADASPQASVGPVARWLLLAKAGLDRLGREFIPAGLHVAVVERILPAPGQGAIAVECRKSDLATIELLRAIHHEDDGAVCHSGTRFPSRARRRVSRGDRGLGSDRGWKIDSSHISTFMKAGICYLVGAGPGDPGLFTIKGRACLERAEVVVYDYLCNPALL